MRHVNIRSIVLALVAVGIGTVAEVTLAQQARPIPGEMGRPGEICLLGVCTKGSPQRAGELHEPTSPPAKQVPASTDPDPLVGIDAGLKNLPTSQTEAAPVSDWVGISQKDFQLGIANDFIASGYCLDVKKFRAGMFELQGGFTPEQKAALARAPLTRTRVTASLAYCAQYYPDNLACMMEFPDSRADKEAEFRATNDKKKQELGTKLKAAEAGLAQYRSYDCKI
jgi:hypothetical protein